MPIYEYGCTECGKHIEVFQKITDEPLTVCPDCGGEVSKLISSTSFVLKGGGWYSDGYSSVLGNKETGKTDSSGKKDKEPVKPDKDKTEKNVEKTTASSSADK